ncbi:hypothetical protein Shyhy01_33760 [Streptomyces hygroscopicus subsp. hygroscopicus]|nr:hypothetical protein Shyhy01_33760 [Streptomyces hygroscopicus subsp. hygroscopicus]
MHECVPPFDRSPEAGPAAPGPASSFPIARFRVHAVPAVGLGDAPAQIRAGDTADPCSAPEGGAPAVTCRGTAVP